MESKKIEHYKALNIYSEKWWEMVNVIDKEIDNLLLIDKIEYYHLNRLEYEMKKLVEYDEIIYENVSLTKWFKNLVEAHATLLLWVLQESEVELTKSILYKYRDLEIQTVSIYEDEYDIWLNKTVSLLN